MEVEFSSLLRGKTLLGEIVLSLDSCDLIASHLRALIEEAGQIAGTSFVTETWQLVTGTWLVNEAFYNFESGEYWPPTLRKIGIVDIGNCSTRFGQAFLKLLRDRGLPRFHRLKTRWHYLGPILGHCGIPRSCLPEFFEKVLPRAAELGIGDGGSFDELRLEATRLYLRRATERFIVFGDRIAEGFVERALDMDRLWRLQGYLPVADELGLPARVVEAYREWAEKAGIDRRTRTTRAARSLRRPQLGLDPHEGVVLDLPSQKLEPDEPALQWIIEQDSRGPVRIDARALPGEEHTRPESVILGEPFSSLRVHATVKGSHVASWTIEGVTRQAPLLFFDPDSLRTVPRRSLGAQLVGIAHPQRLQIRVRGEDGEAPARIVEEIARPLPLSWSDLHAFVYDLAEKETLLVVDDAGQVQLEVELQDAVDSPTLEAVEGDEAIARDDCRVFVGAAPILRLPRVSAQSLAAELEAWSVEMRSLAEVDGPREAEIVPLAGKEHLVQSQNSARGAAIRLDDLFAMGAAPWGEMSLRVRGPLGQDARFHLRIIPELQIECSWLDGQGIRDEVEYTITTPTGGTLRGAVAPAGRNRWTTRAPATGERLVLELRGLGGRPQQIPVEIGGRTPTWALYDPAGGRHLIRWGREPFALPMRDAVATSPTLLLRLVTPQGLPCRAELVVAGADSDLFRSSLSYDEGGFCRFDLLPAVTAASASGASRLEVRCELDLGDRTVLLRCGELTQTWAPSGFSCDVDGDRLCFHWHDQFPVAERCIEIVSLLTPWNGPRHLPIPDTARDRHEVLGVEPGRYLASLGVLDGWTQEFQRAAVSALTVDVGDPEEWRRKARWPEARGESEIDRGSCEQPELSDGLRAGDTEAEATAVLATALIDLTSGATSASDIFSIDVPASTEFAHRILAARTTLGRADSPSSVLHGLDRLLQRLPPSCTLAALTGFEGQFEGRALLESGVFARGAALRAELGANEEARRRMGPDTMESLWRLWPPLGLWADTILLEVAPLDAARRIEANLGAETVKRVCAVAPGALLGFKTRAGDELFRARVGRIVSGEELGPFAVESFSPGVSVEIVLEDGGKALVQRQPDGAWTFEESDGEGLPDVIASLPANVLADAVLVVSYGRDCPLFGGPPEYQILQLVRRQQRAVLRQIEDHSRLPVEAVGPAAFVAANLAWCLRANETVVKRLSDLCAELVPDLAVFMESSVNGGLSRWTVQALRKRWIPNAHPEPLYAVPLVCGAAVATMLWRGLGRSALFPISEEMLDRILPTLIECVPELVAHDLMMVCLAEATSSARRWPNADRSVQADA
ncbi:MAG TPA: hypothetical protein VIS07_07880 [Candidatus Binatia bacterium]